VRLSRVGGSRREVSQNPSDEAMLVSDPDQQAEIDVLGRPGRNPAHHGESANDAEPPTAGAEEPFGFESCFEDRIHGESLRSFR
jgi:hypothetical protein